MVLPASIMRFPPPLPRLSFFMSTVAEPVSEEFDTPAPASALAGETALENQTASKSFFYGWLMLPLATLVMVCTAPGQTFGLTYFNPHFQQEFNLTKTGLSSIYLVATLLASFLIPLVGHLADRHGLRRTILAVVAAMAIICAACSQIAGSVTLFLAFLALRITGPGSMTLLATNTLATWFDRRLGKISGYTQIAMAVAIYYMPKISVKLIGEMGWRNAYLVIGGFLACVLLPLLFFLYRQSPYEMGQLPDGFRNDDPRNQSSMSSTYQFTVGEAMRHRAYWILVAATALWALIGTGLFFHLAAVFDAVGVDAEGSTKVVGQVAITMGAMQLLGGILADRFAIRWILLGAMTLLTAGCVIFAAAIGKEFLVLAYLVFGLSQGLMTIVANTSWARFYGRAHLGKIRGMSLTAAVAGSAIGPVVMGVSADYLGGFAPSFWLFGAVAGVVTLAACWVSPPEPVTPPAAA